MTHEPGYQGAVVSVERPMSKLDDPPPEQRIFDAVFGGDAATVATVIFGGIPAKLAPK